MPLTHPLTRPLSMKNVRTILPTHIRPPSCAKKSEEERLRLEEVCEQLDAGIARLEEDLRRLDETEADLPAITNSMHAAMATMDRKENFSSSEAKGKVTHELLVALVWVMRDLTVKMSGVQSE